MVRKKKHKKRKVKEVVPKEKEELWQVGSGNLVVPVTTYTSETGETFHETHNEEALIYLDQ